MSRFAIDDQEMDALYGLRYGAKALYFFLRGRMNYSTGEVGRKPMISRWTLREALFIEPKRGRAASDSGTPSEKEVRGYEQELAQAGLIEYRSIPNQKQLIFFLIMATKSELRSREVGQVSTELGQSYQGQEQTQAGQGFAGDVGQEVGQGDFAELGHTSGTGFSGNTETPSLTSSSRVSASVVRKSESEAPPKNNPQSVLPAVPVEVWQWKVKVLRSGFDPVQASSPKAQTQYVKWCADRVSQAEFDAALAWAIDSMEDGNRPSSPCYLVNIITQQRASLAAAKYGSAKAGAGARAESYKAANRAIGGLAARMAQEERARQERCIDPDGFEEGDSFGRTLQ
ncbi:MAG: hypothetical protein NT086_11140 [Proteobacteria bacterium]|nr:hypothetical protein [Pseudomonadota bacterium]